jgi:hypothetical protein
MFAHDLYRLKQRKVKIVTDNNNITAEPPPEAITGSSLAVHLRHLAGVIHDLGPEVLGYMVAELAGLSSAAVNVAERYAALTPYSDFIAAYMPQRPCVWRVK